MRGLCAFIYFVVGEVVLSRTAALSWTIIENVSQLCCRTVVQPVNVVSYKQGTGDRRRGGVLLLCSLGLKVVRSPEKRCAKRY